MCWLIYDQPIHFKTEHMKKVEILFIQEIASIFNINNDLSK